MSTRQTPPPRPRREYTDEMFRAPPPEQTQRESTPPQHESTPPPPEPPAQPKAPAMSTETTTAPAPAAATATPAPPVTALSTQPAQSRPTSIGAWLKDPGTITAIAAALPRGSADRFMRAIVTAIHKNPKLARCTVESMQIAALQCAQMGLMPGPENHVYLIPRARRFKRDDGTWAEVQEVNAQRGYAGDVELMMRSGQIASVRADIIWEAEYNSGAFDLDYGAPNPIKHKPMLTGDRGRAVGAYVVVSLKDATLSPLVAHMRRDEIEAIRAKVVGQYYSGPWERKNGASEPTFDELEMWKKTLIHRIAKIAPKSAEMLYAMELDEEAAAATPAQTFDAGPAPQSPADVGVVPPPPPPFDVTID